MAKICYIPKKFSAEKTRLIAIANDIIVQYNADGHSLTVRQLYYQFVARGHIANNSSEYSRLQGLFNEARLAGEMNWDAIVDRTRGLVANAHWSHPRDVVKSASASFQYWKWENQPNYVEVWVEKDALKSIVGQVCDPMDVAYFSCRGYTSVTEVHSAAMRMKYEIGQGKTVRIIHLGDHDPSGIDMTRDIQERLRDVFGVPAKIYRVALNMNQIERYNPPPNPAKLTDSRVDKYIAAHGESSWELDALDPNVLSEIISSNILHWRDDSLWDKILAKEQRAKNVLSGIHDRWNEVVRLVNNPPEEIK